MKQLKEKCRERKLKVSGAKDVLAARLCEAGALQTHTWFIALGFADGICTGEQAM
jgi:hypothetical protein